MTDKRIMDKKIAIMQPTYMPWLGYFAMIDQVDEFVFLDSVQLVARSWQVRNKIKYENEEKLLTIPIDKSEVRENRLIINTKYKGVEWKKQHIDTIKQAYKKAQYYSEMVSFISSMYDKDYNSIGTMNEAIIVELCKRIGIETPIIKSSELDVIGKKDILLANICEDRNAKAYLSAQGSFDYIEANKQDGDFSNKKIKVYYLNYEHPRYKQLGDDFIPYIGIYDLLFNEGFENALKIIRTGERINYSSDEYRRVRREIYD